ncbi:hypothetical protein [Pseudonocardia sp.]|uniref:hypothetical protein n=1 Tax=Pseudonocardia sp. TaxID=60912 RepID=UPI0031FD6093
MPAALTYWANGDRYVGMGLLVDRYESALNMHWRTVLRAPEVPGFRCRHGADDRAAAERGGPRARAAATDRPRRQQPGEVYERLGYRVVGRHPRAIRVGPDDYRDEMMLVTDLV